MSRVVSAILAVILLAAAAAAAPKKSVHFSGNEHVDSSALEKAASHDVDRYRRTLDHGAAEDAAFEMRYYYLAQGYPFAKVSARFVEEGVVFFVHEGPRVYVDDVKVTGVTTVAPDVLARFVSLPKTWFLGSRLYVRSDLDAARQQMRAFLRQAGYMEAEVKGPVSPRLEKLEKGRNLPGEITVDVRYQVEQGPISRLTRIVVKGAKKLRHTLEQKLRPRIGQPYGPFTRFDLQGVVTQLYGKRGFPFADATVSPSYLSMTKDKTDVEVEITVHPGPKVRVRRLDVEGNVRTQDYVIRRLLTVHPGDVYDASTILKSRQRLFATGLFGQVNVDKVQTLAQVQNLPQPVPVDLRLRVQEADFRRLQYSIGFGSWDFLRSSVSMTWLNLHGTGRSLTAQIGASFKSENAQLSFTEPWVFGVPDLKGTTTLSLLQEERPTFSYIRESATASLTKKIGYKLAGSLSYGISRTRVTNVSGSIPKSFENAVNLSSVTVGVTREARDNPFQPTKGSLFSGSVEFADPRIGSQLGFARIRFKAIGVLPLGGGVRLVGQSATGIILPYGGTSSLPLQERFFLGGSDTVRSFRESDLGPRLTQRKHGKVETTGDPSGGQYFSLFNLELRYPIVGSLQGAFFADAGTIIRKADDVGFTGYRYAVGAGLRFITPLGPLRVDAGVNPDPTPSEDRWAVFFAVGYPF